MKLSPLIKKLQKLEQKLGNIDICISFNGCHNSGELLEISEIRKEEFFINDETGEFCLTSEYETRKEDKLKKLLILFSDREEFDID